jgi:hypothetical protein
MLTRFRPSLLSRFAQNRLISVHLENEKNIRSMGGADLCRTAEADGVFCYTFFKAGALNNPDPGLRIK